jgi:adenine-specific DNA-methyltransferase
MSREQIDAAIARYADQETLYDQPYVDKTRVRVTGPFTVEAVPAPTVRSLEDIEIAVGDTADSSPTSAKNAAGFGMTAAGKRQESLADFRHAATPLLDASVARKGATLRHTEWRDELLKTASR